MAFAAARFRAAASTGLAVATLFTVTSVTTLAPVTSAAPLPELAPAGMPPAGIPAGSLQLIAPPETLVAAPADLVAGPTELIGGPRNLVTGPAELIGAPADLIGTPASLIGEPLDLLSITQGIAVPSAASSMTAAARVIRAARGHLGARWVHGATGPRTFDCIGLVLRAYSEAGQSRSLGNWSNRSGFALYRWAKRHHLVSRSNPQPGDVVVWGGGGHVGIYIGNGRAISALTSGVRTHGVHAVTKRFTAYIHTGLAGMRVPGAVHVTKKPAGRSIGTRYAKPSLSLRTGHTLDARVHSVVKGGTKLKLVEIWHDAKGRTWYRVNANRHVGWVLASQTRA